MQPEQIAKLIEAGLPGATVFVDGDGTHFTAVIVSGEFAGKSILQQHRMVYATLGESMGTAIHALSMQTWTPEQWRNRQGA